MNGSTQVVPARRLRRSLLGVLVALGALTAGGIGGAAPASATDITIQSGDTGWTYLGQYWVWSDGWYVADAWAPAIGGGRLYCWAGTSSCWFENFQFGDAGLPWLY
jgi:hypothetical protein